MYSEVLGSALDKGIRAVWVELYLDMMKHIKYS